MSKMFKMTALAAVVATGFAAPAVHAEDEMEVGGRIMFDASIFDDDDLGTENVSGTEFRRIRFHIKGEKNGWGYQVEPDYSDDEVSLKDVFIDTKFAGGKVTIGQFKQYFSLEELTSSRHITFMERSFLTQTLATSHQAGLGYLKSETNYTLGASVYNLDDNDNEYNEGLGFGGRFTFTPVNDDTLIHLGIAAAQENYGPSTVGDNNVSDSRVRTRARLAGHMSDHTRPTFMDLNNNQRVSATKFGLEAAGVFGPVSLQAEYAMGDFEDDTEEGKTSAYYVYASFFPTGESRVYDAKKGRFNRVTPKNSNGAIELGLRYDFAQGEESPVGGANTRDVEAEAITFGATWYATKYTRFMANYITSEWTDSLTNSVMDETDAITLRAQIDF